jgi:GGDEF domain-containing protein
VQNGLRSIDTFGRYGGEEFIQILPHTNLNGALVYAERIRIQALSLDFSEFAKRCSITVSIGVAQYQQDESVMQTFSRADAALYSASKLGATASSREEVEYLRLHRTRIKQTYGNHPIQFGSDRSHLSHLKKFSSRPILCR